MPVVATIKKLLLDTANGTRDNAELPEELQLYKNYINLSQLTHQLPMLPDVIRVQNQKLRAVGQLQR